MPSVSDNPFKWRHYHREIILLCVRWYLRYPLSFRQLAEMMRERGLRLHHTAIFRWVQRYAPELDRRCRPHLKSTSKSYHVDETYVRVKGKWKYLYRAVDKQGQTIDFLLAAHRDVAAAKRFFNKALQTTANPMPRVINVDRNPAYPAAIEELKEEGILRKRCKLRQVRYLNNIVEQDHRFIKRRMRAGMGFFSFPTAWRTLQGFEAMHMIGKGRVRWVAKGDVVAQVKFIHRIFGVTG